MRQVQPYVLELKLCTAPAVKTVIAIAEVGQQNASYKITVDGLKVRT